MNINKRYRTIYDYATKMYVRYWRICYNERIIYKSDNPEIWSKRRYYSKKRSNAIKCQREKGEYKV